MRVPLADVGRHGRMSLTFGVQNGRTVLKDSYCEVPFKITRLLESGSARPHMILMHSTAGLFGGDDLECSIRIERGASVRITQQSATKIHPSQGRVAFQRTRISVESGANLQFYLEPVIPFADSSLNQSTSIDVHAEGRLSYWEGFMTGRVGSGESWRFDQLASETELSLDHRLLYLDRFQLSREGGHDSTWAMGKANYFGTGLFLDPRSRCFASALHQALHETGPETGPESGTEIGIDATTDALTTVRVVASDGPSFHRCREVFCRHADLPAGS